MKTVWIIFVSVFFTFINTYPQDYPPLENNSQRQLNCNFEAETGEIDGIPDQPFTVTGPENLCIILAVAEGYDPIIRYQSQYLKLKSLLEEYYDKCSFGLFSVDIHLVAKNIDITNDRVELFEIQGFDPNAIVATDEQIVQVLEEADINFDFNLTDGNHDGKVDHFNFCLLRMESANYNGCTLCMHFDFPTNDLRPGTTNQYVHVDASGADHMKSGTADGIWSNLYIMLHELSHSLFKFPDMEHAMGDGRWYATGSFDGIFNGVPSLYNPLFRLENGWIHPTRLNTNSTLELKNFETDPLHPVHYFWDENVAGQYGKSKFMITYHDGQDAGIWDRFWPIPHPENDPLDKRGAMIWRWMDNGYSIKNNWGSFSSRMKAPISIESRHGKWEWNETANHRDRQYRKFTTQGEPIPNIVRGLDSLGIKGSYTWKEGQIWKGTWEDLRVGSFNCFFTPFVEKDFAFYTNPSSNLPVNSSSADWGKRLVGNNSLKNLRVENGITKIDFVTGEESYFINKSETIKADTLYIDHTITIKNGATFKIVDNSKIYLRYGAQIIIENGKLEADGTTFYFTEGTGATNIIVSSGSNLKLNNCKIFGSANSTAIWIIGASGIKIENCEFKSNDTQPGNLGIYIAGMLQGEILIKNNIIENYTYGVLCAKSTFATIQKNQIIAEYPINLFFISELKLSENVIVGTSNSSIGVMLSKCVGISFKNNISNCYRGSYLIGSDIGMGQENIHNNYQYGFYLANYSIAKLAKSNETDNGDGLVYDLRGYNTFYNNGQMVNGSGFDNSEIFIDNSIAHFNGEFRGNNSIMDNRINMPFDTRYLISGTTLWGQSVLQAGFTYWGNNINYTPPQNPDGRFKNINVNFTPYLLQQLFPPPSRSEFMVYTDNFGNVIDTIYAEDEGNFDISYIEQLLVEAGQYINQELYDEAIILYKTIIENHGTNIESIEAYYKLLSILNKINASSEDFQYFIAQCTNNQNQCTDTVMKTFIRDIRVSGLVSISEFQTALSELEFIIQTNPGSSEAFYAEIERLYLILLGNGSSNKPLNSGDNSLITNGINTALELKAVLKNSFDTEGILQIAQETKPGFYALDDNYPNPFNPTTVINFQIPKDGLVTIKVYDILGKEVTTLVNENKSVGRYSVNFNGSGLASGVYVYQLISGDFVSTKKMMLIK